MQKYLLGIFFLCSYQISSSSFKRELDTPPIVKPLNHSRDLSPSPFEQSYLSDTQTERETSTYNQRTPTSRTAWSSLGAATQTISPIATQSVETQTLFPSDDENEVDGRPNTPVNLSMLDGRPNTPFNLDMLDGRPNTPVNVNNENELDGRPNTPVDLYLDIAKINALQSEYPGLNFGHTCLLEANLDIFLLRKKHLIDMQTRELISLLNGSYNISPRTRAIISYIINQNQKTESLNRLNDWLRK